MPPSERSFLDVRVLAVARRSYLHEKDAASIVCKHRKNKRKRPLPKRYRCRETDQTKRHNAHDDPIGIWRVPRKLLGALDQAVDDHHYDAEQPRLRNRRIVRAV